MQRAAACQIEVVTPAMNTAVAHCSRDLRYAWASKAYADWLERPLDQIVGRSIEEVLGSAVGASLMSYFERVLSGETVSHEQRIDVAGIGPRWINATYTPVYDADGVCNGWVAVLVDIDARKNIEEALRESEMRFRELADSLPVHIWMADVHSNVVLVNARYLEYTGERLEDLSRDGWIELLHPEDADEFLGHHSEAVAARRPYRREVRIRGGDNAYRWFEVFGRPRWQGGQFAGYVGASVDVTERREAVEALRIADRRKDEFLATLAHELRNPLAPIRNATEILKAKRLDPELAWSRDVIDRQVSQMARLLDDLLDVSRITRNQLSLRMFRVSLESIIESAVETSAPVVKAAGHELLVTPCTETLYVDADPLRLAQVFANLLNNAAKYTRERGVICLAVERNEDALEISVRDNGIGIASEELPRIFDMFAQGKTQFEFSNGLGIGLALSKRLVEMHGGCLAAQSDGLGRGSTFVVRLPLARATALAEASVGRHPHD